MRYFGNPDRQPHQAHTQPLNDEPIYDPTEAIDEFLDAGGTYAEPIRGFPEVWTVEALGVAYKLFMTGQKKTPIRACELAISEVYQRHEYSPSWNAPLFPEQDLMDVSAKFRRDTQANGKKTKPSRAGSINPKARQSSAGPSAKSRHSSAA